MQYVLPPIGRRINFHSQQLRALNLVEALHWQSDQINRKLPDLRRDGGDPRNVAIVGGGLAGLTAAVGFACKGHRVRVFEASPRVLDHQKGAFHRDLHPSVNFWPEDRNNLCSTTTLPFFEWFQGSCTEVIKKLHQEWQDFCELFGDDMLRAYPSNPVVDIQDTDEEPTKLSVWTRGERPEEMLFDLVVVASGFRKERESPEFPTPVYWAEHPGDDFSDDMSITETVVSGAGDGGIIEALRSLYIFQQGKLAFRIAELLVDTSVEDAVLRAERALKDGKNDVASSSYKEAVDRFAEEHSDIRSEEFVTCPQLCSCADSTRLCRIAKARELIAAAKKTPKKVVLLNRELEDLALSRAAPIHKLMAMIAKREGRLNFQKGAVTKDTEFGEICLTNPDRKRHMDENYRVIVRHGADTNFSAVFGFEEENGVFTAENSALSNFIFQKHFSDSDFAIPTRGNIPRDLFSRASLRQALAVKALIETDSETADDPVRRLHAQRTEGGGKTVFVYSGPRIKFGVPNGQLFGVDVVHEDEIEITTEGAVL